VAVFDAQVWLFWIRVFKKHVAVLERAALVTKVRRGREQIVHANGVTLGRAATLLDSYEQLWIQRAIQIEEILAKQERATP
jgi:hypothetical protein